MIIKVIVNARSPKLEKKEKKKKKKKRLDYDSFQDRPYDAYQTNNDLRSYSHLNEPIFSECRVKVRGRQRGGDT